MFYVCAMIFLIFISFFIKEKKNYCITCGIILLLIYGLKDPTLGNSDNISLYIPGFYKTMKMTYLQVADYYVFSDIHFFLLTKFIVTFCKNLNIYFLLCEIPLVFFTSRLIYKYSKFPSLSFIMFFSLNYFSWSFIIIRQTFALGFLILSFDYIKNNKIIKFIITVIIASLFHKTSLIFLLAYPIYNCKRINKYFMYITIFLSFIIIYFFGNDMLTFVYNNILKSSHYIMYQNRESVMGIGVIITYLFVIGLSLFFTKDIKEYNGEFKIVIFGLILTMMAINLAEFFRMGMLFNIYGIILLPNVISKLQDNSTKKIIINLLYFIFIIYGYKSFNNLNLIPYQFFF